MNLNKVLLIGRLAADPESRTTPNGQTVVTLRVATNRVWNNRATGEKQEQVEFHTVIAWGGLADISSRYLRKGQMAFFEGRLQTRSWQGQDGVKRYRTEIIAENLQLGPKAAGTGGGQPMNSPKPQQQNNQSGTEEVSEENIPVIDEGAPVSNDPAVSDDKDKPEEKEIDLKDIPF